MPGYGAQISARAPTKGYVQIDLGQTREIYEEQDKYFKGKVVTFTIQSLIL